MNLSINKNLYHKIIKSENLLIGKNLYIKYCYSKTKHIGFIIPKTLGSASLRNLFKRRCREAFVKIDENFSILVKPKKSISLTYQEIFAVFNKIGNS